VCVSFFTALPEPFPSLIISFFTQPSENSSLRSQKKCSLALEIAVLLFYECRSGTYILSGKSKYFALRFCTSGVIRDFPLQRQLTGIEEPTIKKEGGVYIYFVDPDTLPHG